MSTVSTFIFVHDQQIILNCDANGKFKRLPNVIYVFLGMKGIDKITGRADVIIARDLQYNIEQYPKFCSFTGWYALWKNNLIQSDYVHLFEYDITLSHDFNKSTENYINQKYEFIGYIPLPILHFFISQPKFLSGIIPSIKNHYGIDIKEMVDGLRKKDKSHQWSSTSNSTFSFETFNQYMNWFERLIDDLKNDIMCGHAHERSITFFYLIFNKRVMLTNKLIKHLMLNSHSS